MSKLSRGIAALKLGLDAKKPEMLLVTGIVAMGAAVVVACRQTLKLEEKIAPLEEDLHKLEDAGDKKGADAVKSQMIVETAKVYAPPALLFIGGAMFVVKGHQIMQDRQLRLALAYTATKKAFDAYRARVIEDQGHASDQYYMNGSKDVKVNNHGYPMTVQSRDWDESKKDPYNRVFSQDTSRNWENDLGMNKHFIACQQRFAQQKLNRDEYYYLNDAYEALGMAKSDIGQVVGWKVEYLPDGTRNVPVVDFGIDKPLPDDWKYNQRREVYLDFNCQGLIVGGKIRKMLEEADR